MLYLSDAASNTPLTIVTASGFAPGTPGVNVPWGCIIDTNMNLVCTPQPVYKRPAVLAIGGLVLGLLFGSLLGR